MDPGPWILGLQARSYPHPQPHPSSWPSLPHSPAPSANPGPEEGPRVWTGGGFCVRQAMSAEAQGWGVSSARAAPGRLGRPQPAPHPDTWPSSAPAAWAPPAAVGGTSARLCDCAPASPRVGRAAADRQLLSRFCHLEAGLSWPTVCAAAPRLAPRSRAGASDLSPRLGVLLWGRASQGTAPAPVPLVHAPSDRRQGMRSVP